MHWSPDRRLQVRMALALALTLLGYGVLLLLVFALLPESLALLACGALALVVFASVTRADVIAYWATRGVAIERDQHPRLYDTVERLARQADLPRPPVAVVPADEPNALSAGTGNRTVLCVTTGLLKTLDEDELEAVVAHELAHIKNSDSTVMTVAGFPTAVSVLALTLASRTFTLPMFVLGVPFWFGLYLVFVGLPVYLASLPGTLVLSRYREYAADRGAVAITGDPYALASALATIHGEPTPPDADLRRVAGFTAFCIVPTDSMVPVSTHPPTHRRIARLREQFVDGTR